MNQLQQLFNVDNFIVSQVNPHLVPFLFHSVKAPIPLFDRLFKFLANEFHLYLSTIFINCRELGIFRSLSYFNTIIAQRYTGDVTIMPDVKNSDYLKLLSNPTIEYLQECSRSSERSAWKHISRLQALCEVEVCLDEGLRCLRTRALHIQQQQQLLQQESSQFHIINENYNNNNDDNDYNDKTNNDNNNDNNNNSHQNSNEEIQNIKMNRVASFQAPNIDPLVDHLQRDNNHKGIESHFDMDTNSEMSDENGGTSPMPNAGSNQLNRKRSISMNELVAEVANIGY